MGTGTKHTITRTDMRYFVDGKEISEKQAKEIERRNAEYMSSGDFSLMAKCQFVIATK